MDPVVLDSSSWWESLSDEEFQFTFRMGRQTFTDLQAEIDYVEKRHSPNVNIKLLACVWFLGNTLNHNEVANFFEVHDIEACLLEYSKKIIMVGPSYITWPTIGEASYIEKCFASDYEFPGVVGVIGSLYIEINPNQTKRVKSAYYNKDTKKHMIVLQIVCDNHLLIRDVSVGFPGGETVENILKSSPLYAKLIDKDGYLIRNGKHLLGGYRHPELPTLLTPYDLPEKIEEFKDKKQEEESMEEELENEGGEVEYKRGVAHFKGEDEGENMEYTAELEQESHNNEERQKKEKSHDEEQSQRKEKIQVQQESQHIVQNQHKAKNQDKEVEDNSIKAEAEHMDIIQTIEMQMEEIHSEKTETQGNLTKIQEKMENKNATGSRLEKATNKTIQLEDKKNLLERKCNFNFLHDSVMQTVEQTFRCMEMRFPRLTSVEMFGPSFSSMIVTAICVLHNFTRVKNDNSNEYS